MSRAADRSARAAERASARAFVNAAHAARRRKVAIRLTFAGFVILVAGLFLGSGAPERLFWGYLALVVGSIVSWIGIALLDRWVALPRQEEALAKAIGARLEDAASAFGSPGAGRTGRAGAARYTLYSWLLPADHVVAAPWGLAVVDVNTHDGPVRIEGARWKDRRPIFRRLFSIGRRPIRNPRRWLDHEIRQVREALADVDAALAEVPIEPAAFFAREKTAIEIVSDAPDPSPEPAVLRGDDLLAWLRGVGRPALAPAQRHRLIEALDRLAAGRVAPEGDGEATEPGGVGANDRR